MAAETGIAWTDSTHNPWWGCTKVANNLACVDCYAEDVDNRSGGGHWGHGMPRRRMIEKTRNLPRVWNARAGEFFALHGRDRRVFTLSMGDLFDKEVPDEWRFEQMGMMADCNHLKWQICTKRIPNLPKMMPPRWDRECGGAWPKNVGVLITVVTQAEADRDVPRLLELKKRFGITWVGVSYEPAAEAIDFRPYLHAGNYGVALDWIIFGGKSGAEWKSQPFDVEWPRSTRDQCADAGVAFFMKQMAAFQPKESMIPEDLRIRQFPKALQ